ncbi:MAG: hypothetical protein HEP71_30180 [Roseivirga sp.]|nr:hypothetical protein [Roseivirga sp.]
MNWSRKQLKVGFWGSIGLIITTFVVIGCQHQIPIQFTSEDTRSDYQGFLVLIVPIALLMAMTSNYLMKANRDLPILHIFFGTILGTVLLVSASVLSFFSPQWSDAELLYQGRFTKKQIILQNDSWSYQSRIIKVTPLAPGIRYITPVDTMNLPDHKWVKLKTTSDR